MTLMINESACREASQPIDQQHRRFVKAAGSYTLGSETPQQGEEHGTAQKKPRAATGKQLMEKLQSQGFRCALSGKDLTVESVEVDHIVPVSEGGTDHIDNLQLVDRKVNRMKGAMSNEEFVRTCKSIAQRFP